MCFERLLREMRFSNYLRTQSFPEDDGDGNKLPAERSSGMEVVASNSLGSISGQTLHLVFAQKSDANVTQCHICFPQMSKHRVLKFLAGKPGIHISKNRFEILANLGLINPSLIFLL